MVLVPGRNWSGSASSTRRGRSRSSLRPLHRGVLFGRDDRADDAGEEHGGEPPAYLRGGLTGRRGTGGGQGYFLGGGRRQDPRAGADDLHADDLADGAGGLGAGVGGGLDGGDVTDHDGGDEGVADLLHGADEGDVGRLEHGVGADDEGGEAAGFEKSDGLLAISLFRVEGLSGLGQKSVGFAGPEQERRFRGRRPVPRWRDDEHLGGGGGGEIGFGARGRRVAAGSSTRPSSSRPRRRRRAASGLFSPMPAVKTRASQPPSSEPEGTDPAADLVDEDLERERGAGLPAGGGGAMSRRSLLTPERPSSRPPCESCASRNLVERTGRGGVR
jgi:hypothetical protein